MNTSQLKAFAQRARNILRSGVARQLTYWGFDHNGKVVCQPEKVGGGMVHREEVVDDPTLMARWEALHLAVKHHGFDQVVEEGAYTWFNRLMAIRILSKNGYDLPQLEYDTELSKTPHILQRARRGQYAFLNSEEQDRLNFVLADYTKEAKAFAILLNGYCHSHQLLNSVFGRMDDYTELLLPNDMLGEEGFVHLLNSSTAITDEDYRQVELIGWLYQFYISEKKDQVFKQFKNNQKAEAADIPAATQIFTPNWIVKYMVENTVGKIWLDKHPNSPLRQEMKYLVENSGSEATEPLIEEVAQLKLLDPAAGSGHILVEGFDLLYQMYLEEYYMPEEAVESILANNLYGVDIDLRAAQLARFALLMKAASKYAGILKKNLLPKVYAMPEPVAFSRQEVLDFLGDDGLFYEPKLTQALELMQQAQNLGSTIQFDLTAVDGALFVKKLAALRQKGSRSIQEEALLHKISPFVEVIGLLSDRYEAIAANPPYMGQSNMNNDLKTYINRQYPLSKSDLFAVFMEVCLKLNVPSGLMGMINQHSWMFLSSYEKLRGEILEKYSILNMVHLGPRTFEELSGEVVQSTVFVLANDAKQKAGTYFRLVDYRNNQEKEHNFLQHNNCYANIPQSNFKKIPGSPIAYWVSEKWFSLFEENVSLEKYYEFKKGMSTGDNTRFNRFWYEVSLGNIFFSCKSENDSMVSLCKWYPLNSGGDYKKWYGNQYYVTNWQNNGLEMKTNAVMLNQGAHWSRYIVSVDKFFKDGIAWNAISAGKICVRNFDEGFIFSSATMCGFGANKFFLIALLNSKVSHTILEILSPTMNYGPLQIKKIPCLKCEDDFDCVKENCALSRRDWDSHETSWDFKTTPLFDALLGDVGMVSSQFVASRLQSALRDGVLLADVYEAYETQWTGLFYRLHANEEELNRIFIDIYGLNQELDPMVPLKEITILQDELDGKALEETDIALRQRRHWRLEDGQWQLAEDADVPMPALPIKRDVVMKQLISYAIGCMMGRYRLDRTGLHIAHPNPTPEEVCNYSFNNGMFEIDDDAIIPLMGSSCSFGDDAVNRLDHFLELVWGSSTLTANKNFMAECLDEDIEKYLVKGFWKDHCKTYKKRPIYWLFSSEKGAFQVLVYMHRMNRFTVEKIRSKYLLKYLQQLQQDIALLEGQSGRTREEQKRLDELLKKSEECQRYELLLKDCADKQIEFDLDEGVAVNYELFKGVVAPIK